MLCNIINNIKNSKKWTFPQQLSQTPSRPHRHPPFCLQVLPLYISSSPPRPLPGALSTSTSCCSLVAQKPINHRSEPHLGSGKVAGIFLMRRKIFMMMLRRMLRLMNLKCSGVLPSTGFIVYSSLVFLASLSGLRCPSTSLPCSCTQIPNHARPATLIIKNQTLSRLPLIGPFRRQPIWSTPKLT